MKADKCTLEFNDINLRKVALEIKSHGERYADSSWCSNTPVETQSRIIFIQNGCMYFKIDGKSFTAKKNQLVLVPENRHVEYGVPDDSLVHCRYCNFNAEFGDVSIWDYMEGDWVCEIDDPKKITAMFKRFDCVDDKNLIRDFIDKKMCLATILSEFMKKAKLRTRKNCQFGH